MGYATPTLIIDAQLNSRRKIRHNMADISTKKNGVENSKLLFTFEVEVKEQPQKQSRRRV